MGKNSFVSKMDKLPWIVKLILCLPILDISWVIYRIIKGVTRGKLLPIIGGILWIIPGGIICWVIDFISTILYGRPKFLA